MKIVIVEDEMLTAEDLAEILLNFPENIDIVKILSSVSDAIVYFKQNSYPDLIFCDIQLGDGHSFEIFKQVKIDVPVIFCTAYDEFALEAFQNNGIAYILKPFIKKDIKDALEKYKILRNRFSNADIDYEVLFKNLQAKDNHDKKISSLLINWKDKIIPVKITDIALFSLEYKMTQLTAFNNQKYFITHTLEELEEICGRNFFRANRQFLINRESISEALQYSARKLVLKLKIEGNFEIIISKNKVPEFLSWLKN